MRQRNNIKKAKEQLDTQDSTPLNEVELDVTSVTGQKSKVKATQPKIDQVFDEQKSQFQMKDKIIVKKQNPVPQKKKVVIVPSSTPWINEEPEPENILPRTFL